MRQNTGLVDGHVEKKSRNEIIGNDVSSPSRQDIKPIDMPTKKNI